MKVSTCHRRRMVTMHGGRGVEGREEVPLDAASDTDICCRHVDPAFLLQDDQIECWHATNKYIAESLKRHRAITHGHAENTLIAADISSAETDPKSRPSSPE